MPDDKQQQRPPTAQVGVAALIIHGGKLLLMRRAHSHGAGTWSPPGGHIDFGEMPEDTAIRETREETGVTIAAPAFRGITSDVFAEEGKHYITLWYDVSDVTGEPRVNAPDEMTDVGWFPLDALPEPLFLPLANLLAGRCTPASAKLDAH